MKQIGTFNSPRWGTVHVRRATYGRADGPTAIVLTGDDGEPLATLSVNLYRPDCSHDSRDLPPDCFYAKCWSENEQLAEDALKSGLFLQRDDMPAGRSGFVIAPVWQLAPQQDPQALGAA